MSPTSAMPSSTSAVLHAAATTKAERYATLSLPRTARFFADKAAAFSSSADATLHHARHLHASGHHRRALHLLQSHSLHDTNAAARLLAAQCLFSLRLLDECLAMLGGDDPPVPAPLHPLPSQDRKSPHDLVDLGISGLSIEGEHKVLGDEIRASLCVLRARVYESLGNPNRAVLWYKRALRCDVFCVDAFLALTESCLLSREDALAFVRQVITDAEGQGLAHSELATWLASFYRASLESLQPVPLVSAGVQPNVDILAISARRKFDALDFEGCVDVCRTILRLDPYIDDTIVETYLATLVELDDRQQLFVTAHSLVDRDPRSALSWMAVGYYYFACNKPEVARRFFQKATSLNSRLLPAWIAYGHAFGAQDESDQAMASYRTASRLFPGAQLPLLFMGMEYARQSSLGHASTLFQSALEACPTDPAPRHELGVVAYRLRDMPRAVAYFKAALSLWEASDGTDDVSSSSGRRAEAEEATLYNLGHCYRRLREFPRAKRCYERALGLRAQSSTTCTALGITLHTMGDTNGAVAMYHRALRYNPDDSSCAELLERALCDMFLFSSPHRPHYEQPYVDSGN